MFHHNVFLARRNILALARLALVSAIEHAGAARKPALSCSQNKKDASNGTLYQRHQDDERPVRASAAGHLLRRETACESASKNGREGDRPATQAGFFDPSRRDQNPRAARRTSVPDAWGRGEGN